MALLGVVGGNDYRQRQGIVSLVRDEFMHHLDHLMGEQGVLGCLTKGEWAPIAARPETSTDLLITSRRNWISGEPSSYMGAKTTRM